MDKRNETVDTRTGAGNGSNPGTNKENGLATTKDGKGAKIALCVTIAAMLAIIALYIF